MSLGSPWMLLLLTLVALAGWFMIRARRLQREAACRLKGVASDDGPVGLGRQDYLRLAALVSIVLALARPQWNPRPYDVERRGRDLVIALDVSRSMLAADILPSRLEAVRIAIHETLPALAGQRIALVTFAGSASVRVPLTLDHDFVRFMLERADPSDEDLGSTSLQAALDKAVGTVLSDAGGGRRDLVMFTDGEDHLSDIEQAAETLAKSGARVLIIGLGDPVQGARVPDASNANQWMRYEDADVVSRLQEDTLATLADKGERVTYYPARTRPFDLWTLYQQMIFGAADDVVVGQLRQVRYTEGYPYLLGLAVALWLASAPWGLSGGRYLFLVAMLLPGCAGQSEPDKEAAFQARFQRGGELVQYAQEQPATDAAGKRSLLLDAREEFLRAALLRPGDIEAARCISGITRLLRELDTAIAKQRAEEEERHQELAEMIGQLEELTLRQVRLSQQSARLLARRLVSPKAEPNYDISDNNVFNDDATTSGSGNNSDDDDRLALPAAKEQQAVHEGTTRLFEGVMFQRNTLRQLLKRAYGDAGKPSPTELDPAVSQLTAAQAAQQQALANLVPSSVSWPRANTAFHIAAGRMHQTLESLRSLQPPSTEDEDSTLPSRNEVSDAPDMNGPDSEADAQQSQPVSPGDFTTALSLPSLPVPHYTPEEILAEESANQQNRARQKAARAGANVEKNW